MSEQKVSTRGPMEQWLLETYSDGNSVVLRNEVEWKAREQDAIRAELVAALFKVTDTLIWTTGRDDWDDAHLVRIREGIDAGLSALRAAKGEA